MDIDSLGKQLVSCPLKCDGIINSPEKGIIPRCLYMEERNGESGAIIVGLNPGRSKEKDQNYFLGRNNTYDVAKEIFFKYYFHHPYYKRLREIVALLGFSGNILWTELVKCECSGENGVIPMQTMRICINRYLKKEIEMFPDYTLFAVGNRAFDICAVSFPQHFIVGIPHPTGSYGQFPNLKNSVEANAEKYIKILSEHNDKSGNYNAIKLFQ